MPVGNGIQTHTHQTHITSILQVLISLETNINNMAGWIDNWKGRRKEREGKEIQNFKQ